MKRQFKSLSELEHYIKTEFADTVWQNQEIKNVVAEEISQAVLDVVYTSHDPVRYNRRMDDGGLSDVDNVDITFIDVINNKVSVTIENLTEGNDNMKGKFITDMIEEGDESKWSDPNGVWSEPRPFIETATERLKSNPGKLKDAVVDTLKGMGLNIK